MHGQEQDVGLKRQHCNRQASDLPSRFTMATCLSLTVCFRHCNPAGDGVAGNVSFCRLVSVGKMLRTTTLLPLRSSSMKEIGSCGNLTKLECPKYRVCKLVNELKALCGVAATGMGQKSFDRDLGKLAFREMPE